MKKERKKRVVDVNIHDFSSRGNGIGMYDHPQGMKWTLEVPFTLPGDFVRADILKKRKGAYQCVLEEILVPSPKRIKPKCIHFGICGGCRLQQISYADQLEYKEAFVKRCFENLITPEVIFHPISPSLDPWEYRNKMEFSFSSNRAGDKFLGLMMDSGRGKVLNLKECHLVHSWFIDALSTTRQWWETSALAAYHPSKNTGALRTLIVREGVRTGQRLVMLTVSGNVDYAVSKHQLADFVSALRETIEPKDDTGSLSIFLRIQQIAKGRPTEFYEMPLYGPESIQEVLYIKKDQDTETEALTFTISPSAFFQPNTLQAERLYSRVIELGMIPKDAVVYDLYCGTGTLGISLAKHVKEVIGVELSAESAVDANTNLRLNSISNMRIIMGDVGDVLKKIHLDQEIPPPDVVLVDPPRTGLDGNAVQLLLRLNPAKIIYVSCNPVTQASNTVELVNGGYELQCLQPVDQFPQTMHVENIAIFMRKG
ncbi:MAG: 23S rRNA (uracil(1939)-C(5))-methyltransferase RlmD [Parachlamydiaceae bacterium]|nr:23S rRNA (uracil(1939)-C(5))-methyltransferase RlmD [Parachlamydiaceae bacterium]